MSLETYAGTGTSLSSSFYLRNFYSTNRDARTSSKRKEMDNNTLSLADGYALRRAIKQLGSSEYNEDNDTNIRCSVKAFIETYNNTLSSTSDSSDHTLQRNMKQLKSIASEYADDLDKLGITVNKDGTLTSRDTLFGAASLDKFEDLFSSDSDFMQRTSACAKRIERRSESLGLTAKNQELQKIAANKTRENVIDSTDTTEPTEVAQIVSQSVDLDTLLNTGIGQNVNITL